MLAFLGLRYGNPVKCIHKVRRNAGEHMHWEKKRSKLKTQSMRHICLLGGTQMTCFLSFPAPLWELVLAYAAGLGTVPEKLLLMGREAVVVLEVACPDLIIRPHMDMALSDDFLLEARPDGVWLRQDEERWRVLGGSCSCLKLDRGPKETFLFTTGTEWYSLTHYQGVIRLCREPSAFLVWSIGLLDRHTTLDQVRVQDRATGVRRNDGVQPNSVVLYFLSGRYLCLYLNCDFHEIPQGTRVASFTRISSTGKILLADPFEGASLQDVAGWPGSDDCQVPTAATFFHKFYDILDIGFECDTVVTLELEKDSDIGDGDADLYQEIPEAIQVCVWHIAGARYDKLQAFSVPLGSDLRTDDRPVLFVWGALYCNGLRNKIRALCHYQ